MFNQDAIKRYCVYHPVKYGARESNNIYDGLLHGVNS